MRGLNDARPSDDNGDDTDRQDASVRLIQRAAAGEEIVIVRGKVPVARLTAIPIPVKRRFGAYRGEFEVPDGFFEPLPEVELDAFEA